MKPTNQWLAICAVFSVLGAGCLTPLIVTKVAQPLGAAQGASIGVPQKNGFGTLPLLPLPSDQAPGVVRINAELPSLQPNVTVVRLPGGGLDRTQFQNLTDAIHFPVGMLGDQPVNLSYRLTWSDGRGYLWTFTSEDNGLRFNNMSTTAQNLKHTLNQDDVLTLAKGFLTDHGIGELTYRNLSIASATATDSVTVTYERVVDERNIVDLSGRPELGGKLSIDPRTGEVKSGWITLSVQPDRTDYPAITAEDMRHLMEAGGMGGTPQGTVDIQETFFTFVRHPKTDVNGPSILSPVLVGQGTQTVQGNRRSFRIVVPLVKQTD